MSQSGLMRGTMLAIQLTMALFSNTSLSLSILLYGLLFARLVNAQTETIYMTQTQTLYTACQCPAAEPPVPSVSRGGVPQTHSLHR